MRTYYLKVAFTHTVFARSHDIPEKALYSYKTTMSALKIGDDVVVETRYGPAVARVATKPTLSKDNKATAWAFQRVEPDILKEIREKEERKQEIIDKLERMADEQNRMLVYERLAATNSLAGDLLDELKKIDD